MLLDQGLPLSPQLAQRVAQHRFEHAENFGLPAPEPIDPLTMKTQMIPVPQGRQKIEIFQAYVTFNDTTPLRAERAAAVFMSHYQKAIPVNRLSPHDWSFDIHTYGSMTFIDFDHFYRAIVAIASGQVSNVKFGGFYDEGLFLLEYNCDASVSFLKIG